MNPKSYIALPLPQSPENMKRNMIYNSLTISVLTLLFSLNLNAQVGVVTVNQDEKIPEMLELKKTLEKENELSDGYTIQLFYGDLSGANEIQKEYKKKYTNWPSSIEYETPNYKVWVGNFNSRIEADRAQIEIHKNFPAAFILRPNKGKKALEKDKDEDDKDGPKKD